VSAYKYVASHKNTIIYIGEGCAWLHYTSPESPKKLKDHRMKKLITLGVLIAAQLVGCESNSNSDKYTDNNIAREQPELVQDNPDEIKGSVEADETAYASFDEFRLRVQGSVSSSALNCGVAAADDDQVGINTCVGEAFNAGSAFFAIYRLQGIDSDVGGAVSSDGTDLNLWHYDSNPAGGSPALPSVIESKKCSGARLSGVLDGSYRDVFICE
jgi:hypothetical protein